MIPNKTNNTDGCINTSSNCVIWQGPDLTCVDVCNGDTISDIMAKMCESILNITTVSPGIDISTVNQLCLQTTYGQANNLESLLQNIITEVCKVETDTTDPCSCIIPLPKCLQYRDEQGNEIVSLPLHNSQTGTGYAVLLANRICANITAINRIDNTLNQLESRVTYIENNCCTTHGTGTGEPTGGEVGVTRPNVSTVRPQFVGSTSMSVTTFATAIDRQFGALRNATGTPDQLYKSISYQPSQLSSSKRLNGTGTMSALPGWISSANNLAQSHQNLWLTTADLRYAVENLQSSSAKTACSDLTMDVSGSVNRTGSSFQSIDIDFRNCNIPSNWSDCRSNGTKIVITDSALSSMTFYADVATVYQNSANPFIIPASSLGALSLTSNFSVTVYFSFCSEDSECGENVTFTIDNAQPCPSLNSNTPTDTTIAYNISPNVNADGKTSIVVNLRTSSGSTLQSRTLTTWGATITGTFSGLTEDTAYQIQCDVTPREGGGGNSTSCAPNYVTTNAPVCTSTKIAAASYTTCTEVDCRTTKFKTGANTLDLGVFNDGSTIHRWTAGFDNSGGLIVVKDRKSSGTGLVTEGTFVNNQNSTQAIVCGGTSYAATGISTGNTESGWKYVNTLTGPGGVMYFVYSLINETHADRVNEVVFCCDCTSLFLNNSGKYGVNYAAKGETVTCDVNVVGFTSGTSVTPEWTIVSQPTKGTVTYTSASSTSTKGVFTYVQNGDEFTSDSFQVRLTNGCGNSNTLVVPIIRSQQPALKSTRFTVFIDTATYSLAKANEIKTSIDKLVSDTNSLCSGASFSAAYVAVAGTESGDYLKHQKAMVDMYKRCTKSSATCTSGGSITLATGSGTWTTFNQNIPAEWQTGFSGQVSGDQQVVSFVSDVNENGSTATYGAATLGSAPAGWTTPTQPTTNGTSNPPHYQQDYDAIVDMKSSAAPKGPWAIATQGISGHFWKAGSIPFTIRQTIVTALADTTGVTSASVLQMASAVYGDAVTTRELAGLKFGGSTFNIDLTSYLNVSSGQTNPYGNTTTPAPSSNVMTGLQNFNVTPHPYFQTTSMDWSSSNTDLLVSLKGMIGMKDAGDCPSGVEAKQMGTTATYAPNAGGTVTAASACTQANTAGNRIQIFNTTGTQFDTTVKAYTSLSGATNAQTEYELPDATFYALGQSGACNNCVAKYDKDKSSGGYWELLGNCT
jgi:hypothetical protein